MQSKLIQKLQELNHTYKTNCKVKFIDSDQSYYYKGVITLGLETKDPEWTLCHEFKHFLQDHKRNYLYLLKHKIIKRTVIQTAVAVLYYSLAIKYFTDPAPDEATRFGGQMFFIIYILLFSLLIFPPLMGKMKDLYKDLNHHLEFEADKFATKHSGVIPYESRIEEEEESTSHPSGSSRMATMEEEFPQFKIN